jgi:hypothetical protein
MEGVTHHYVSLPTGVRLHYVEWAQTVPGGGTSGRGLPPLVLCHGWPDFWFTWRHQVRHVRVSPPALLARCLDRGSPPPPVCRYELLGQLATTSSCRTCVALASRWVRMRCGGPNRCCCCMLSRRRRRPCAAVTH